MESAIQENDSKSMVLPGSMWSAPAEPDVTTRQLQDNSKLLFIAVEYVNNGNLDYSNINSSTFSTGLSELDQLNSLESHPRQYSPVYPINNELSPTEPFNPIVILPNDNQSSEDFNNLDLLRQVVCRHNLKQEESVELLISDGISYSLNQDESLNNLEPRNELMDTQELVLDSGLISLDDHILMENGTLVLKQRLPPDLGSVVQEIDLDNLEQPDTTYDLSDINLNMKIEEEEYMKRNNDGDKTEVRRSKRQLNSSSLDNNDLFSDCPECVMSGLTPVMCENHRPLSISDKPVPSRAIGTLPAHYLSINRVNNNVYEEPVYGVFAKKTIPKRAQFGPVEGVILKDRDISFEFHNNVHLILENETGDMYKIDTSNEDLSNWMRFVRKAETYDEQNLFVSQVGPSLYFFTTNPILPRQELKVGYSCKYAEKRNLPLLTEADIRSEELPCFECDETFASQEELDKHLDTHDDKLNEAKTLKNKRNNTKKKIVESKWKDSKQDSVDSIDSSGVSSTEKDPLSEKENEEKVLFNCKTYKCKKVFGSATLLELHNYMHTDNKDSVTSSEEQHRCPECYQNFTSKHLLAVHVNDHEIQLKVKTFKCQLCYKPFSTRDRLARHMEVHCSEESKPLPCKICGKRFLTSPALLCHLKVHKSDKIIFECPICKKSFSNVVTHREHVKTHCSDGIYKCPECPKECKEYYMIRKHIRAFHCPRNYQCTFCDKRFYASDKLRSHLLRHSDIREFLCSICGKQFKRNDKLKEHYKRLHEAKEKEHEDSATNVMQPIQNTDNQSKTKFMPKVSPNDYHRFIYKCHTCLVGFKRRGMLVNHLAKRHPEVRPDSVPELNLPILRTTREYYCQYCDKVYKSSSKRKAHIIKIHPGLALPPSNRHAEDMSGLLNPVSFSQTVGSVTTIPHNCLYCHKQYATKAKLLQHERSKHPDVGKDKNDKTETPISELQPEFLNNGGFQNVVIEEKSAKEHSIVDSEHLTENQYEILPVKNEDIITIPIHDSVLRALLSSSQPNVERVWSGNDQFSSQYIPPR